MASKRSKTAGHRRWGAGGEPVPGDHTGDFLDAATRSRVMSRIRAKNTGPEQTIEALIRETPYKFERHVADLPGSPDFVFPGQNLIVFVDGDFWHGWRYPLWQHKLSQKWRDKIEATRKRDSRNFRKLRSLGWCVLRIWEHQVEQDPTKCIDRILCAIHRDGPSQ